jgi:hypothetical protein
MPLGPSWTNPSTEVAGVLVSARGWRGRCRRRTGRRHRRWPRGRRRYRRPRWHPVGRWPRRVGSRRPAQPTPPGVPAAATAPRPGRGAWTATLENAPRPPLSGAKLWFAHRANLRRCPRLVNGLVGAVDLRYGYGPAALIVVLLMVHLATAVTARHATTDTTGDFLHAINGTMGLSRPIRPLTCGSDYPLITAVDP